jgi:PBP4 family serine-type D-alanyl-D-alanine carboxypeptidase
MKSISILVLVFFFGIANVHSQQAGTAIKSASTPQQIPDSAATKPEKKGPSIPRPSPLRELQTDLEEIINLPELSNASVGIAIQNIESGEYFFRKNESRSLLPASTQKILTTAAGLELLGRDFRYTTRIYTSGIVQPSGEFTGNLIIRAAGDPTMSPFFYPDPMELLDHIAQALDSLGIRSIRGNLIIDHSYFDNQIYGPGWAIDDIPYPYSAQVSAIAFYDNKVDITVLPGEKPGDPGKIGLQPENDYVRIINMVITGNADEPSIVFAERDNRSNIIEVRGRIGQNQQSTKLSIAIDNPPRFFLHLLRNQLEKQGLRIRGALIDSEDLNEPLSYSGLKQIYAFSSPPLSEIIAVINKFSHNLCAEMLLKTIGKESSGTGSFPKGTEQVKRFAASLGLAPDNLIAVDGSGLSRLNLITPQQQVTLLSRLFRSRNREDIIASLSMPGAQGTLRNRLTRSRAEKSVYAKTGSMNNVSCLCGYIFTRDSEALSFSIMVNGFTVPESIVYNMQDLICMRLASFSRK